MIAARPCSGRRPDRRRASSGWSSGSATRCRSGPSGSLSSAAPVPERRPHDPAPAAGRPRRRASSRGSSPAGCSRWSPSRSRRSGCPMLLSVGAGRGPDRAARGDGGMDPLPLRRPDRRRRPGAGAGRHAPLDSGADRSRGDPAGRTAPGPVGHRGCAAGVRRRARRLHRRPRRRQPDPRRPTPRRRAGERARRAGGVGGGRRPRSAAGRGRPRQATGDRALGHAHQRSACW